MKRLLPLLLLLAACQQSNPIDKSLSEFLSTRSAEPLESTIWEHQTQDEYNRYISFKDGVASLFYGTYDGELQRWSEFYSAPYAYKDGVLETAISYPLWGQEELTESAFIVQAGDNFTLRINNDTYTYWGPYTEQIEGRWITINVGIKPWE